MASPKRKRKPVEPRVKYDRPAASRSYQRGFPGWPLGSFYDGTPGRNLIRCPDCQGPAAEAVGGDHSGTCVGRSRRVASILEAV